MLSYIDFFVRCVVIARVTDQRFQRDGGIGRLHTLSFKDTMNKQAKFFDFKVQLKEEIVRGVCFSLEKKRETQTVSKVQITNKNKRIWAES